MNNRAVEQLTPHKRPADVQIVGAALIDDKPGRPVYLAKFTTDQIAAFVPGIDHRAKRYGRFPAD